MNKMNSKQSIHFRQKVCCLFLWVIWGVFVCVFFFFLLFWRGVVLCFCFFKKQKKVGSKHSNRAKSMTKSLPLPPFSGEERMCITAFLPVPTDVQNQEIAVLVMN